MLIFDIFEHWLLYYNAIHKTGDFLITSDVFSSAKNKQKFPQIRYFVHAHINPLDIDV